MAIIAVGGRKGGVGKSTIVGNLAAEFAAMGRSVIVLDADPQHSLAAWAAQGESIPSPWGAAQTRRGGGPKRWNALALCRESERRQRGGAAGQGALGGKGRRRRPDRHAAGDA